MCVCVCVWRGEARVELNHDQGTRNKPFLALQVNVLRKKSDFPSSIINSLEKVNTNFWINDGIPGWKNMAAMTWSCHDHTMIMAKHGHDHAMIMAWWPCFLAWSPWFMAWSWFAYHVFHDSYHDHGMIIMFCIFFLKKKNILSIFSQIVCVIYHYMAHLTAFRGIYAFNVTSQQNWTKNTPGNFRVLSVTTKQQVLIKKQLQYNINITAVSHFW